MNILGNNSGLYVHCITYNKRTELGPRQQRDLQLVYVYSGAMTIWVDGDPFELFAGQATLLTPGHQERFRFADTAPTHHGWGVIDDPSLSEQVQAQLEHCDRTMPFTDEMRVLAEIAMTAQQEGPDRRAYTKALIYAMFHEVITRSRCLTEPARPMHPGVERARQYIDAHITEPLTVEHIAETVGISTAHLIRLFKRDLGQTPNDFLWQARTQRAAQLLRETGFTVAEVSHRSGFATPQHFSRVFKQHYDIPPGQYRKTAWAR